MCEQSKQAQRCNKFVTGEKQTAISSDSQIDIDKCFDIISGTIGVELSDKLPV
jgi:hypothetical protein